MYASNQSVVVVVVFSLSLSGRRYLTRLVIQLNLTGGTLDLIHPSECINRVVIKKKKKKMQSLQSIQMNQKKKKKKRKKSLQEQLEILHNINILITCILKLISARVCMHTCSLVGSQCALLHERIPTSCG